jgi:hypothetical protein
VTPGAEFAQDQAVVGDVDDGEVGDDPLDDALAGQGQRALLHDLVGAVLGDVLHEDDDLLGAVDQVHRAAHALDHLARGSSSWRCRRRRDLHGARIAASTLPPRIIPKLVAESKNERSAAGS